MKPTTVDYLIKKYKTYKQKENEEGSHKDDWLYDDIILSLKSLKSELQPQAEDSQPKEVEEINMCLCGKCMLLSIEKIYSNFCENCGEFIG